MLLSKEILLHVVEDEQLRHQYIGRNLCGMTLGHVQLEVFALSATCPGAP